MRLIGMARLGKDFELRFSPDGSPVGTVVCAWGYGKKDSSGKQTPQWCELALWGDRAEKLGPHLLKGQQIYVIAGDVRVENYAKRDGSNGSRLVGRIESIEFGAKPAHGSNEAGANPVASQAAKTTTKTTVDQFENDQIPF